MSDNEYEPIPRPWKAEPDHKAFDSSGYGCEIKRVPGLGSLCGYVGIPQAHPWYGLHTDARVTPLDDLDVTDRTSVIDLFLESIGEHADGRVRLGMALDVHWGITFAGHMPDDDAPGIWRFGFDCGHAGDLVPLLAETVGPASRLFAGYVYRDMDYVTGQCARLAAQLRLIARRGTV
jgi:hypothetical protein